MKEESIQIMIADWLSRQYPWVMFRSDGGGLRLPIGLAVKFKRLNGGRRAWPDFFVAEPVGKYKGLFIEIKACRDDAYMKSGELRRTAHVQEQAEVLLSLSERGYTAVFGCGFEDCIRIIKEYLEVKI